MRVLLPAWGRWMLCVFLALATGQLPLAAQAHATTPGRTGTSGIPRRATHSQSSTDLTAVLTGDRVAALRAPLGSQVYFPEGFTGTGAVRFTESLDLLNTNPITASGQIEYFHTNGITTTVPITIPAQTHLTEKVANDVGSNQLVSAVVATNLTIGATRTISRTTSLGAGLSESISGGIATLSPIWYFAEGYTGSSFQQYLALLNPGDVATAVVIQPSGGAGTAPLAPIMRSVPPHSRITINLRAALPNRSLGLLVQADQPIAAERVLYWGAGSGSGKFGTAVSAGVRGPAAVWSFPYASTENGSQVYLAITDPTTVEAHVRVTFYDTTGAMPDPLAITVEPGTRATATVPVAIGSQSPVGMVVSSDVPVVAEQSQYFGGSPNSESHSGSVLAGTAQPAARWLFPGFDTSNYATAQWYVLNTGGTQALLTATLYAGQGQPVQVHLRAGPHRLTSVTLPNLQELQSGSSSAWSSNTPVVIAQVLHGASNRGLVVAGIASDLGR